MRAIYSYKLLEDDNNILNILEDYLDYRMLKENDFEISNIDINRDDIESKLENKLNELNKYFKRLKRKNTTSYQFTVVDKDDFDNHEVKVIIRFDTDNYYINHDFKGVRFDVDFEYFAHIN